MQVISLLSAAIYAIGLASAQEHEHPTTTVATSGTVAPTESMTMPMPTQTGDGALPPGFITEEPIDPAGSPKSAGGKILKQRLGPWTLQAGGTLANRPVTVPQPCSNCYITAFQAGLEYVDGTEANINTGAWLHHMVLFNRGTGKKDLVCGGRLGIMPARIFASGNERTVKRIDGGGKFGVYLAAGDSQYIIVELMNEGTDTKTLYLTMTYEYQTASSGYANAPLAWLDATGCGISDVPAKEGYYELRSPTWTSTVAGKMLLADGHVHDGGTRVIFYKNNNPVCISDQLYGRRAGYIAPGDGHGGHGGMDMGEMQHISDSGLCKDFGDVAVGDELVAVSQYNATLHPQMVHDGELHPVMGIGNIYIGPS